LAAVFCPNEAFSFFLKAFFDVGLTAEYG